MIKLHHQKTIYNKNGIDEQYLEVPHFSKKIEKILFPNVETNRETENEVLSRVIRWQLSKRRSGNHAVKSRSTVHHSTRKMFAQKGRGHARVGDAGSNIRRGGGIAMGPVVRSHAHDLPKKVRRLGRFIALLQKLRAKKCSYVVDQEIVFDKTKEFLNWFHSCTQDHHKKLQRFLFITNEDELNHLKIITNNIHYVSVLPLSALNVYDIVKNDNVIFTEKCCQNLILEFKKEG